MAKKSVTVVGIDVGGPRKGYHAVVLRDGKFETCHFARAADVLAWANQVGAEVIAVDAPCKWASSGKSRFAERSLRIGTNTIQCFKTPTQKAALGRRFYEWVFQGEALYKSLESQFRLYDGNGRNGKVALETFPHAVACWLETALVPARPKAATRRRILRSAGYSDESLPNIDFVDAALCAVTADRFKKGLTEQFGDAMEGYIVVPRLVAARV